MGRLVRKPTAIKLNLDRMIKDVDTVNEKVGWFQGKSYPHDGPQVWQVAQWMELGVESRSIPPRPMFMPTFVREAPNWQKIFGQSSKKVVRGQWTIKQAFDYLGSVAVGDVQKTISSIHEPELSPLTILLRKYQMDHVFVGSKHKDFAPINGKIVGEVAKTIGTSEAADVTGISIKPLEWTGLLYGSIINVTEQK